MTSPDILSPPTQPGLPKPDKLWLTDDELIRHLGVPKDVARQAIRALDENRYSGFPKKEKLWGDRRFWPAVWAFMVRNYIPKIHDPSQGREGHGR